MTDENRPCGRLPMAAILCAAAIAIFCALPARADEFSYGDFKGTQFTFTNVSEANAGATALFRSPSVSGNSLDFNPLSYSASTSNGGTGAAIGNLSFGIVVPKKNSVARISNVILNEFGSTTLTGNVAPGSQATASAVFANGVLDIHRVDFEGINHISVPFSFTFNPSGGTFFLGTDGGGGPLFNTSFTGSVTIPVSAILVANGFDASQGATDLSITLSNELHTISELGTSAYMSTLDFGVVAQNPEPAGFSFLAVAALALLRRRRTSCE